MCFGSSEEPSQWDGSFEYPQHMFWLRNKKNHFPFLTLIWNFGFFHQSREFWFDSLCPHQQSFSYVGTGHPGLNQYKVRINMSCSRTQRGSNLRTLSVESSTLPLCSQLRKWAMSVRINHGSWDVCLKCDQGMQLFGTKNRYRCLNVKTFNLLW